MISRNSFLVALCAALLGACADPTPESGTGGGPGTVGSVDAGTPPGNDKGAAGGAAGSLDAGSGSGEAGLAVDGGVDPGSLRLAAIAASTTVGLEWPRVAGATGYRLYWSTSPGVTPASGTAISIADARPAYVHRGLTNGSAYHYVVSALTAAGEGPPSNEVAATPTGEWVLEQLGTGEFDDILSGNLVARVPIDRRVHVFLLPEGYLAADLTTFHNETSHSTDRRDDVDSWIDLVFALDAYASFREAFVVWYLPVASAAHAGAGNTAFHVGVRAGSVESISGAAAPLWNAIDGAGPDAFPYPPRPGSGNHIAAFLIFDPDTGRAGVSGLTSFNLRNPIDNSLGIPASFGADHHHEFTHAFSQVWDEYLDPAFDSPPRSETVNVSPTNKCGDLPWAHLLEGAGINSTPNLVGAFGRPVLGYHSELKCLMNGWHDNGQFWCPANNNGGYPDLGLRVQRMCNFCRELTVFHVFERTGILGGANAFATWKAMYRPRFYQRFKFVVPAGMLPETLSCTSNGPAVAVYEACAP